MNDDKSIVKVEASVSGLELLSCLQFPMELNPSNFKIFQRYIFPEYKKLGSQTELYLLVTFMHLVGNLSVLAKKFIEDGIRCESEYSLKMAAIQEIEGKEKRRSSQDNFVIETEARSNLESQIYEISDQLFYASLDITANIPPVYQTALASQLYK